jgi:hypothetical protein
MCPKTGERGARDSDGLARTRTTTCVVILLYMCPHTTVYVSSYYYTCVRIQVNEERATVIASRAHVERTFSASKMEVLLCSLRPHIREA